MTEDQKEILIIIGSILGALSFLFGAIEFFYNILKKAKINLIITNDIFFRIINEGESLFAIIIIIGENKLVRIVDLNVNLENNKDNRKITFKIKRVGKNRETDSPFQDFSFYSTSVYDFISPNESKTLVLHAVENDKSTEINKAFLKFDSEVITLLKEVTNIKLIQEGKEKNDKQRELFQNLNKLREDCLTTILQNIKIVDGKYTLTVKLQYRSLGGNGFWFLKRLYQQKTCCVLEKKLLTIENSSEKIKNGLNILLWENASNLLGFPIQKLLWPQINPSEVEDITN